MERTMETVQSGVRRGVDDWKMTWKLFLTGSW